MNVIVEFKIKGHLIRAKTEAPTVDEGIKEIQIAHPGCEIVSAYRGHDERKEKLTARRRK